MIAAFVVFIIIIMTFLFCDSSLISNLTQSGIEDMKGGLGTPGIPYFFLDFPQLRQEGGSLLPLEVQSFPPPTLCWWQDFNNYSAFGLHCAGGPVRSSSSAASEEPPTNQDAQDFLWLF